RLADDRHHMPEKLMYSMLVAPSIKARLVGATQVRPMQRRSLDTPHAEASNVSQDAGRMAGYRTGRDQSAGMPDIAGGGGSVWVSRPPSTLQAARYRELRCPCASRGRPSTARWSCDP